MEWSTRLISGWRFSGIHLYQPGPVVRVTSPQSIPGIGGIWPVRVPGVAVKATGCGSINPGDPNSRYLNTNAFRNAAPFTLGNAYTLPDVMGCPISMKTSESTRRPRYPNGGRSG